MCRAQGWSGPHAVGMRRVPHVPGFRRTEAPTVAHACNSGLARDLGRGRGSGEPTVCFVGVDVGPEDVARASVQDMPAAVRRGVAPPAVGIRMSRGEDSWVPPQRVCCSHWQPAKSPMAVL